MYSSYARQRWTDYAADIDQIFLSYMTTPRASAYQILCSSDVCLCRPDLQEQIATVIDELGRASAKVSQCGVQKQTTMVAIILNVNNSAQVGLFSYTLIICLIVLDEDMINILCFPRTTGIIIILQ